MALKVVGAGFGRTGTLSLKHALEMLGLDRCYHMAEVFRHPEHMPLWAAAAQGEAVDWDRLFEGYQAAVDFPACNQWRVLADRYPDARVLLSTRDPEAWYESAASTIWAASERLKRSDDASERRSGEWADLVIWDPVFQGRFADRAFALDVFRRHEATVRAEVPSERLLVYEASQGWEPLCAFLQLAVPEAPFPRTNTRAEFQREQFVDAARREQP